MKNKVLHIMYQLDKGDIKYNQACKQVLQVIDESQRDLLIECVDYCDSEDYTSTEEMVDSFLMSTKNK